MTMIPLLLDPGAQATTCLSTAMSPAATPLGERITLPVDDWLLEQLLTLGCRRRRPREQRRR
jgi:hypothetical protein